MLSRPNQHRPAPIRPRRAASARQGLAAWLALLPFLLLALLPPGVMPGQTARGGFTLVLCTPEGPQEMVLGPDGVPQPPANEGDHCAFAQALPGAALLDPPFTLQAPLPPSRAAPALKARAVFARPRAGQIFARGPPLFL